ncbi:SusC/RagA family TonB-linked outer membrane protein [Flavobacterium subsaxonicum]|uniref:Collagen-binding protein n=1 Tax=Flavobacterium subsaxonicum WB 4.1-42 = DSM 21790 TaxID=1121898 RepID=A0A0A2MS85_9FLAO|nr:TonB-dependent receptor [Flavobacterium subsaxonicum]KGO95164.1 collagen-binding protein [Flavobacterium subsaxonicum WB 4.1-42 = DSM 21790]
MENIYLVSSTSKRLILLLMLCLTTHFSFAQEQNIEVTGTVISPEDNLGIPGVNVVIKGTSNATITDMDGKFSISVQKNAVLVFTSIGFKPQEVVVQGSTVNVSMLSDTQELKEVVVVGYGTQRKEAVTGSVASIKGDALREVPSPNITQALQGRIAGVEMMQTSSKPGATMQVRIRGTRSLTGSNDPLVVLDGIPFAGSIGDISTDDIKSIDILKDASATAIYGSRGANGVILITTNKGVKGQEAKFTYNSYYGLKSVFGEYPMMNGAEFSKLRADAGIYTSNGVDEADGVNTDWQDLFYKKTSTITNHYLGISGGTAKGSYNFSMSYFKDEAVIPLQDYERFSLQASLDQEIGAFRFGFSSNNNYSISSGNSINMYGVLSQSPIANPYNEDGTLKRFVKSPLDDQYVYTREGLEGLGDKYVDQIRAFSSYNTVYAEVKIPGIEGLKFRTNLGGTIRMSDGGSYTGQGVFNVNETTVSTANINHSMTTNWAVENLLTYDRTFAEKHKVNAVALYSAQQNTYNYSSVSARDIPSDAFQFYNLGNAAGELIINPNNQTYTQNGLLSYMARVMYSFDDRYMLSATVRSDGSSVLAKGQQWHTYPAVSAGWNVNKESFLKNVKAIDVLKIRVGYGQTSNQAVPPYKTLGLLSTRPYNFGPGENYDTGYYVSEAPSPNLGWEYSKTWNYGLDFGLFNNRITGTFEYYVQKTEDVLLNVLLPVTNGVPSYLSNIGETQNKGVEFSLNGIILDNYNGFTWDAGVNIYANRNKLVALDGGATRDIGNSWFVGQPINVLYDYKKTGLWQEGDPYRDILEPGGNAGMIKVEYTGEYNADGTPVRAIGEADRQVIDVNPKFQGGFNTHVAYKGFDLGVVGAFQHGGVLISTLYGSSGYLNMMDGRRGNVKVDYWTPENTDAKYPKPGGIMSSNNPKYGSTLAYFDASYVKIRTISLGYTFQQQFLKDAGISKLRLYCTVQNPFVIYSPYHKESGMDPEPNSYGNENQAVNTAYNSRLLTIGTNTPTTRNYIFGMNVSF